MRERVTRLLEGRAPGERAARLDLPQPLRAHAPPRHREARGGLHALLHHLRSGRLGARRQGLHQRPRLRRPAARARARRSRPSATPRTPASTPSLTPPAPSRTTRSALAIARVFKLYEERLVNNNALDFDDLMIKAVRLLRKREDVRAHYNDASATSSSTSIRTPTPSSSPSSTSSPRSSRTSASSATRVRVSINGAAPTSRTS